MSEIRVLIVDDEKDFCLSFKDFLKSKAITADVAFDGDSARHLIESNTYSIIFFDYNMPGITGIDLPKIIKEHSPDAKKILVTGYDLVDAKLKELLGLDALLRKPVKLADLYRFIEAEKA
ncbi:MAG: response regulator [Candidatus Omnitrophica bacterium]|nr:response regulator [Candidatus Omnitrophota bacterium]